MVAGVTLGAVGAIEPPHLTKELLYAVFLPGLVFEAAFHLDFQKFWQNKLAISSLAVPGCWCWRSPQTFRTAICWSR